MVTDSAKATRGSGAEGKEVGEVVRGGRLGGKPRGGRAVVAGSVAVQDAGCNDGGYAVRGVGVEIT